MSTSAFPTSIDTYTNMVASHTLAVEQHTARHNAITDALSAIETKIGVNNSADATSLDYLIKAATDPGHVHTANGLASNAVTTSKILDGAVTSAKIADGTIVNADVNAGAAIAQTKLAYNALTNSWLMSSGTQQGIVGNAGGEFPRTLIAQTSAANLQATITVYYPIAFTSAPTIALSGEVVYPGASNADVTAASTKATTHLQDQSGNYIGFYRTYINNASFSANTGAFVGFSWTATV